MSDRERDSVEDWRLPQYARPPLLGELVERIDEALATAHASEAAVMTVGAAALDAAEQARRAAELAERASASMAQARPMAAAGLDRPMAHGGEDGGSMDSFAARADRVAERLQRLQRMPLSV